MPAMTLSLPTNLCNSRIEVIDRIQKITNKRPAFYQIDLLDSAALEKVFAENRLDARDPLCGLKIRRGVR